MLAKGQYISYLFIFYLILLGISPLLPTLFLFFLLVELQLIFKSAAVERGDFSRTLNLQVKSVKVGSQ